MQTPFISGLGVLALLFGATASAQPHQGGRGYGHHQGGRSTGTVTRWHGYTHGGVQHRAYWQTGHLSHHSVVYDHRAPYAISHDHFVRPWYRGYHARYNWGHFYPSVGWPALWGINTFSVVSGVTCEAANSVTGALYPVSASGVGAWNNVTVNSVLGQALDECAANSGPGVCVPAQPACTYY